MVVIDRQGHRSPRCVPVPVALPDDVDRGEGSPERTQMQELSDGTKISRAPKDMQSWEIIATYRHAWALATFAPSGYLAKALANQSRGFPISGVHSQNSILQG